MKSKVYSGVTLGAESFLGEWTILGEPARNQGPGDKKTIIGTGAVIRSHTVIYAGNIIGDYFQTGHHVLIREDNRIGDNVSIGSGTVIEHHVKIEKQVRIHSQAFIPEFSVLEEGSWIGPNVVLTNAKYPNLPETKDRLSGVKIGKGAVLGANVTVLPGVTIGEGAIIGAGSVVTKDIPGASVFAGNPARRIGKSENARYPRNLP